MLVCTLIDYHSRGSEVQLTWPLSLFTDCIAVQCCHSSIHKCKGVTQLAIHSVVAMGICCPFHNTINIGHAARAWEIEPMKYYGLHVTILTPCSIKYWLHNALHTLTYYISNPGHLEHMKCILYSSGSKFDCSTELTLIYISQKKVLSWNDKKVRKMYRWKWEAVRHNYKLLLDNF